MKPFQLLHLTLLLSFSSYLFAADQAELDCLVRPETYIELSSPVDTTLKQVLVEIGDNIKQGQPLVQLENSVQIAKVALASKQAESTSEIENRQVQLQYAKRNLKRMQNLYKKNSVSLFDKDKADTEVKLAQIELVKAREKRELAQLTLQQAQTELALRTIKSPIDGIVVDSYAKAGEAVIDRTIMKLAQIDPLRVELIAPTEYFGLIEKDMEVDIFPERPAGKSFKAKITIVDQLIDPASGSFTVRMALPNPGDELVGGVNCIARFNFATPASTQSGIFGASNGFARP
jgi:RND family efflux transporter MFP subunit